MNKNDFTIIYSKGSGPGGQHKNKVETCVTIIHKLTGLKEKCEDSRSKLKNYETALDRLEKKIENHYSKLKHEKNNELRIEKLKNPKTIRTYNYQRSEVVDHRSKKHADLWRVLDGELNLLYE